MTFDEYENGGRILYAAFAKAVGEIIQAAIDLNGSIKLQQIQDRAKEPSSLRQKLLKAGVSESDPIEDVAKDLAGCRLVLYSNSDVTRLNNARLLFDNFDIVWERTKLHFPQDDLAGSVSQFIGDNYVVRLKEDREVLPEYCRFAGLLCEVQVQTILNHAWSETAHDTIYKRPSLNGIGARQLSRIEARMKDIQQRYLLPAGYEFQQVLSDFERLATGQRLVDGEILAAIRDAPDNNARVELLEQYQNHVLPLLDDPGSICAEIRAALLEGVRIALSERGVMYGDFGYRDALRHQKDSLLPWLSDARDPVRSFAENAIRNLDNEIAAAQRDAEHDIAMRRLGYCEPLFDAPSLSNNRTEAGRSG